MYHVELDISQAQKKQLKQAALDEGQTVKAYVTALVLVDLSKKQKKEDNTS